MCSKLKHVRLAQFAKNRWRNGTIFKGGQKVSCVFVFEFVALMLAIMI